jgi:penicillin-binding protein 2
MNGLQFRNDFQDRHRFVMRAAAAGVVATLCIGLLLFRVFTLQVLEHEHYATLSDGNRVRVEPIGPTRGLIYDRQGVVLAENVPTYQLELTPEQVLDIAGTIDALAEIVDIRPEDRERFYRLLETQRRFQPVPLRARLTEEEVARFAVVRQNFPGVDIHARLMRHYPHGDLTAHVLGYMGAISRSDLDRIERSRYSGTTHIGKSGIEFSYEPILHGNAGSRRIETNAQGRPIRVIDLREPALPGDDIYLNLDLRLQEVAHRALGDQRGAVVAIDPRDGGVLAMVSRPSFDPNMLVDGLDRGSFSRLERDPARPLFNRALRGRYPPGSTIKPLLSLGSLAHDIVGPEDRIFCTGRFWIDGRDRPFRDWRREGHGHMDMHNAVVESCDVYFYRLAMEMGIDRIHAFLTAFGLGSRSGIDLPGESEGLIPSREWKRRALGEGWFHGETVIAGIGQGYMLTTPLQLAKATAGMANRGTVYPPRVLRGVRNTVTGEFNSMPPSENQVLPLPGLVRDADWDRTIHSMVDSVHGARGTARGIGFGAPYRIAGKTGTAQVFGLGEDDEYEHEELAYHLRDHALFIAFAPADRPQIAIAVVVEHGGGGGGVAAPVARKVMDAAMNLQLGASAEAGDGDG